MRSLWPLPASTSRSVLAVDVSTATTRPTAVPVELSSTLNPISAARLSSPSPSSSPLGKYTSQLTSLVGVVDVGELDDAGFVAAESVFLDEKGNGYAVDFHKEEIGVVAVEDVVGEHECQLSGHTVGLSQAAYLVDVVGSNHRRG